LGSWLRLEEVGGVGAVAHLVADEPQPGEGYLARLAGGGIKGRQGTVVGLVAIAGHGGVHDGDAPHCLADHRQRVRQVQDSGAGQPLRSFGHRGDRPAERGSDWGSHRVGVTHMLKQRLGNQLSLWETCFQRRCCRGDHRELRQLAGQVILGIS
jgi:hypothetical protein